MKKISEKVVKTQVEKLLKYKIEIEDWVRKKGHKSYSLELPYDFKMVGFSEKDKLNILLYLPRVDNTVYVKKPFEGILLGILIEEKSKKYEKR